MLRISFVLLLCLLLPSAALAEKRVALVIGIDKYDYLAANAQLRKARSDAARPWSAGRRGTATQ